MLIKSGKPDPAMTKTSFIWDASAIAAGLGEIERSRDVLLCHLKHLLDEYHGVERSVEYYNLVAGDWLEGVSQNIYAARQEVSIGSALVELTPIPVISSSKHARRLTTEADWHQHLRGTVSCLLQGGGCERWAVTPGTTRVENAGRHDVSRKLIRGIATAKPKVLLTQPHFKYSRLEWIGALWRWRGWIARDDMQHPISFVSVVDWGWRKRKAAEILLPPRDFAELAMALMPLYIPVALLEGFERYRDAALALPISRPQLLYSSYALHGNLTFKLLAAEWRQEGTQLLYHQHGGGYGLDEPQLAVESYEIKVSDRFYSWGWQRHGLPVFPLSPAMPAIKRKRGSTHILLYCLDLPKVPYRLVLIPMPGTIENMHRNTCEFLEALPDRQRLVIRPYHTDYGWGAMDAMRCVAPEAKFNRHSDSFALFSSSSLVVHSYLGTSWLETLGMNIPTLCFYNPAVYIYREEVHPFMDAMERVGILHHSGKSAARFIASRGHDIEGWWNRPEVQEARRNFVEHYANFSPDWKSQWEREFEALLEGAP